MCPIQPVKVPLIERLLSAASRFGGIVGFCFVNHSAGLAALDPLGQKPFAQRARFVLGIGDPRRERHGMTLRRPRLLDPGEAIRQLPASHAFGQQTASGTTPFSCSRQRLLKVPQITHGRFERETPLFLLHLQDSEQAP